MWCHQLFSGIEAHHSPGRTWNLRVPTVIQPRLGLRLKVQKRGHKIGFTAEARSSSPAIDQIKWSRASLGVQQPFRLDLSSFAFGDQAKATRQGYTDLVQPATDEDLTVLAVEHVTGQCGDAFALGGQVKKHVEEALKSKGAVLVRGLPVTTPEVCTQFVDGLQYQEVRYEPAGAPRKKVGERLDAATNIPGAFYLPVHNEMAYNPYPNKKIIMICLHPAQEGGESLIASGAEITAAIPPEILQTFEAKGGVRYTRHWRSAKQQMDSKPGQYLLMSWQERTGCTSLAEAVQYWRRLGCEAQCCEDGSLIAWNVQPACVPDPVSGQPLWFNIVHTSASTPVQPFSFSTTYGDGDAIPSEVVDAVTRAMAGSTRAVKLGAGDMLVLDNYRYLHGRMPYKGDDRVMVTVLTAD